MTDTLSIADVQSLLDSSPFNRFLGLRVESMDTGTGSIAMRLPLRPELERGGPMTEQFHGGPVAALIDTVGDFAVSILVGGGVPTVNLRIDYLRPSSGEFLLGTATVRRIGRTIGVVDIDVTDPEGRLTAVGRGSFGARPG